MRTRRQLNLKFLAGLILGTVLLGAGFYGLHAVQVNRSAGAFRQQANQAQEKGDRTRAIDYLERYLLYRPTDVEAMTQYASLRAPEGEPVTNETPSVIVMYKRILALRPDLKEVRRRCAELELNFYDAYKPLVQNDPRRLQRLVEEYLLSTRSHLVRLLAPESQSTLDDSSPETLETQLAKAPKEPQLKFQLGRCHEELYKPNLALLDYEAARRDDPALIEASTQEAVLLRTKAKSLRPEDLKLARPVTADQPAATDSVDRQAARLADQVMNELIANVQKADTTQKIRAYVARASYRRIFGLPQADQAKDIAEAQRLDEAQQKQKPQDQRKRDPNVLLMASELELRASPPNWAKARELLEEGIASYPQNSRMYESLARLELLANQPRQAESWLRKGIDAQPEPDPARPNPTRAWLQLQLAERFVLTGQVKPAEDLLKQLRLKQFASPLKEKLSDLGLSLEASIRLNEGQTRINQGQQAEARQSFDKARELLDELTKQLTQRPNQTDQDRALSKQSLFLLGQCHEWLATAPRSNDTLNPQDHLQSAYEAYRRVIEVVAPNTILIETQARLRVAALLLAQGKDSEATAEFTKIMRLPELRRDSGGLAQVYQAMAQVYLGRAFPLTGVQPDKQAAETALKQADAVLKQAEAELPGTVDTALLRARAWVGLVQSLVATKQSSRAQEAVQEAQKRLLPGQPLYLARCLELIGQNDQADDLYRKTLEAKPGDRDTLLLATEHAIRRRRNDEAKMLVGRLIEQSQGNEAQLIRYKQLLAALTAAGGNQQQVLEAIKVLGAADPAKPNEPTAPVLARTRARLLATLPSPSQRRPAIGLLEELTARKTAETAQPRELLNDLVLLARLYETDGAWPKAQTLWREQILKINDSDPALLAEYIGALLRNKAFDDAQKSLTRLEKIEPDSPRTLELQARVLTARGQLAEAVKKLQAFAQADRNRLEPVARLLESLGAKTEAEAMYRAIPVQFPDNPRAVLPLVGFLGRQRRTQEGLDLLDDRLWNQVPVIASGACVSLLYSSSGTTPQQFDRVATRIEQTIQSHPNEMSLKFDLANIRSLQGQNEKAETIYRDLIAQNGTHAAILNNLAWLLTLEGGSHLDEASQLIKRAIELEGETAPLLDTRAMISLQQGRPAAAIEDMERAISIDASSDKYFHLARAYSQVAERRDEAIASLRKAEELGLTAGSLHPLERPIYERLKKDLDAR